MAWNYISAPRSQIEELDKISNFYICLFDERNTIGVLKLDEVGVNNYN